MKKKSTKQLIDDFDYLSNAASAMDCTGLIPSLPRDEEEILSYEELYPYLPQAANSTVDGNEETDSVQ